ncbi:hypothetical protein [Clostridioides sp. ES-S-0048-02]|uniref:hypothetical protein n=1 Tax=Clostridioides sp. ES-S-0048-02 TaxID=2770777 RepID=UPI001D12A574|nr:hypothetical protein [Clostridioides sp. ES-S-0048-02]
MINNFLNDKIIPSLKEGTFKRILINIGKIIILLVITGILILFMIQGKYLFYRNGLTFNVNNNSNIIIEKLDVELNIDSKDTLFLTEFKEIKPKESCSIFYRGNTGSEVHAILKYKNKLNETKSVEVAYFAGLSKRVVEVEINSIDKDGNLIINVKGFSGLGYF